jgi:acetyl-CoA carboxylase biotin carboxyl carrier protein
LADDGLTAGEVAEILRLLDESRFNELHLELNGMVVHVRREGRPQSAAVPPPLASPGTPPTTRGSVEPPADGVVAVVAPHIGTFYRAPRPDAEPFVEVGSVVEEETTVAIVEVMKLMDAVPAGVAGTVTAICAVNGEMVEEGQPLFQIRPAGERR